MALDWNEAVLKDCVIPVAAHPAWVGLGRLGLESPCNNIVQMKTMNPGADCYLRITLGVK